jgi:HTH-type transcriptional regulator/antitoxin HigA
VRNDSDHARALKLVERLWNAQPGSPEEDLLDVMVTLTESYETRHHAFGSADPVDAILFRMEQGGHSRADLESILGSKSRASEILRRKRPLSLAMIRRLHAAWNIPLASLIST